MKFLNRFFVKTYPLLRSAKAKIALFMLAVIHLNAAHREITIAAIFWVAQESLSGDVNLDRPKVAIGIKLYRIPINSC